MPPDRAGLQGIATECATLVARQFGRHLDWSLASLDELDAVCADLLADGPLDARRLELWWKLTGACTGEASRRSDLVGRGGVRRAGLLVREGCTAGGYPALSGGSLGAVGRIDIGCGRPVRVLAQLDKLVCMPAGWRCGRALSPGGIACRCRWLEDPQLVSCELGDRGMVRFRYEFGGGQQRARFGHLVAHPG
jgi:hypothetical protein